MENTFGNRIVAVQALTGSHNYNLNNARSDRDYKYFVMPTFDDLYNGTMFSDAKQSDTVDYSCHDVRQLVNLIWKANINFVEVLFSTDYIARPEFNWLFDYKDELSTMNLWAFYKATYGMHTQKMGDLYKGTTTTKDLVDKFGYDSKQACHAYRCLLTIERFKEFRDMGQALWYDSGSADQMLLLALKNGEIPERDFLELVRVWNANKKENIESWYKATTPNEEVYLEAQQIVKDAVRVYLMV